MLDVVVLIFRARSGELLSAWLLKLLKFKGLFSLFLIFGIVIL